jgi:hypothetical protein
MEVSFK